MSFYRALEENFTVSRPGIEENARSNLITYVFNLRILSLNYKIETHSRCEVFGNFFGDLAVHYLWYCVITVFTTIKKSQKAVIRRNLGGLRTCTGARKILWRCHLKWTIQDKFPSGCDERLMGIDEADVFSIGQE